MTPEQQEKVEAVFEQVSRSRRTLVALGARTSCSQPRWASRRSRSRSGSAMPGSASGSQARGARGELAGHSAAVREQFAPSQVKSSQGNSLLQNDVPLRALTPKLSLSPTAQGPEPRGNHMKSLSHSHVCPSAVRTPAARVLSLRCAPSRRSSQQNSEAKEMSSD